MITIFNRKEFATALTLADQIRICKPLDEAGIPYIVRCSGMTNGLGRSINRGSSVGINPEYAYQYRIYVHKSDYERARSVRR